MNGVQIIGLVILCIVAIGAIVTLWIFIVLLFTRVPYVKTPKKNIDLLLKKIPFTKNDRVYDLGCGDAEVLIEIDKRVGAQTRGFEISPFAYLRAWLAVKSSGAKTRVWFKNFRKADISDATHIFVFLIPSVMQKTADWLEHNVAKGTLIISYGFSFPNKTPEQTIETDKRAHFASKFFVYRF